VNGGRLLIAGLCALAGTSAHAQSVDDLSTLSLAQLADIDVSSVSKTEQPLSEAPAAVFVITHDMIMRSGATTLPEMLRLAPNLQVYRKNANDYAITARGMNGSIAAQNFSNKLLVLIDGRSVYTPLFSGVYWDMQDVLPEDIDRIEVISGPGATLWGANAVNGVINVITREAGQSQGLYASVQGGAFERAAGLRYGGRIGDSIAYRVYARANDVDATEILAGVGAEDDWRRIQGGFRADWTPGERDTVTVQGDLYDGRRSQLGAADEKISGGNLLARWTHESGDGDALQVQAYFDHAARRTIGGGHFGIDTVDLDVQQTLSLGDKDTLVLGGDLRASSYEISSDPPLVFDPAHRTLWLASAFAQNTLALTDRLDLTTGLKIEDDPYAGASLLPDIVLSWRPRDNALIWGSVSRAVRSPTPFDVDVREFLGNLFYLSGNPDFRTEKLTAFELGTRLQPTDNLSFSISTYYNLYDDLRSIEYSSTGIPLIWGNKLEGDTYGVEIWGSYRPLPWWRLSASLNLFGDDYRFDPGSSMLVDASQVGSDPRAQASLSSSITLEDGITIDARLRHVGALPEPHVPAYTELDARLGWFIGRNLELSVVGENLFDKRHQEYPGGTLIPRQVRVGLQCWF
jgi:iron complex outermembrane receptor protein